MNSKNKIKTWFPGASSAINLRTNTEFGVSKPHLIWFLISKNKRQWKTTITHSHFLSDEANIL